MRALYSLTYSISSVEDGGNNFASVYHKGGLVIMRAVKDAVRRLSEESDRSHEYIFTHSLSGGTGSGLTACELTDLKCD